MRVLRTLFLLMSVASCPFVMSVKAAKTAKSHVDEVSMMIGTDGSHETEYGGTTPAVGTPFAMTQWCAATRLNGISRTMYRRCDSVLIGFMGTHQPAIWMGDYGFMTLMPQSGELKIKATDRQVRLDHGKEVATPYYYKVSYASGKHGGSEITTEMTATSRASFFHITYPKGEKSLLYLEAGRENEGGFIRIYPDKREVHIYNKERHDAHLGPALPGFKGYYVLKFSEDFAGYGTWRDGAVSGKSVQAEGGSVGGYVEFPAGTTWVDVRIGSSFIDFEQAAVNLSKEIPARSSFASVTKKVKKEWEEKLSKIDLEGASEEDRTIFYTAFFRTLQYPREFSEYGRYYSPFDDKVHQGVSYNAYSLWDTFRAEHPWLQIMAPERVNDMVTALVQMYEEGGWIPKWPNPTYTNIMIGTHADAVIADAYINGFRDYDVEKAYEAIRKDAYVPPTDDSLHRWGDREWWNGGYEARGGLSYYLKNGYVADDRTNESVARTLEFALSDYCIAQMAKALGKTADYEDLMRRTKNYRYLYNPKTKLFQARNADGSWAGEHSGFTEGANWTYQFCVMQDVQGLIDLMGGNESFAAALDNVFDNGHYRHDNEPGHHYVYLYNYCGRFDKAQERIPEILDTHYRNGADGLSGNDDCGQMSAWYLFSSLGFYPVTPVSGEYALGIPRFPSVRVELPHGKVLTVRAEELKEHRHLPVILFNGKKLDAPFIAIRDLMKGGVLEFKAE